MPLTQTAEFRDRSRRGTAFDAQDADWNQEIFPMSCGQRKALEENGVPLDDGTQPGTKVPAAASTRNTPRRDPVRDPGCSFNRNI